MPSAIHRYLGHAGLIHTAPGLAPDAWQRFLDIHLAGLRAVRTAEVLRR